MILNDPASAAPGLVMQVYKGTFFLHCAAAATACMQIQAPAELLRLRCSLTATFGRPSTSMPSVSTYQHLALGKRLIVQIAPSNILAREKFRRFKIV